MLLGTWGASFLGNLLGRKGLVRAGYGNKKEKWILRAGYGSKKNLILPHPKILNQNEPEFNGGFSRDNIANKIKDGNYLINLDEYADTGTHWITLFCIKNKVNYFDSFRVEHVPKEIEKFI